MHKKGSFQLRICSHLINRFLTENILKLNLCAEAVILPILAIYSLLKLLKYIRVSAFSCVYLKYCEILENSDSIFFTRIFNFLYFVSPLSLKKWKSWVNAVLLKPIFGKKIS